VRKLALATVGVFAGVSAFAFVPRVAQANSCLQYQSQSTYVNTIVGGQTVRDDLIFYYVETAGCTHTDQYFEYSKISGTVPFRIGSWNNAYAYISDASGYQVTFYGAKWNGYSGCIQQQGGETCTSLQYATPWINCVSVMNCPGNIGDTCTAIAYNRYDPFAGGGVPSQVEDFSGTHYNLNEASLDQPLGGCT
jgi:hypothetical protein